MVHLSLNFPQHKEVKEFILWERQPLWAVAALLYDNFSLMRNLEAFDDYDADETEEKKDGEVEIISKNNNHEMEEEKNVEQQNEISAENSDGENDDEKDKPTAPTTPENPPNNSNNNGHTAAAKKNVEPEKFPVKVLNPSWFSYLKIRNYHLTDDSESPEEKFDSKTETWKTGEETMESDSDEENEEMESEHQNTSRGAKNIIIQAPVKELILVAWDEEKIKREKKLQEIIQSPNIEEDINFMEKVREKMKENSNLCQNAAMMEVKKQEIEKENIEMRKLWAFRQRFIEEEKQGDSPYLFYSPGGKIGGKLDHRGFGKLRRTRQSFNELGDLIEREIIEKQTNDEEIPLHLKKFSKKKGDWVMETDNGLGSKKNNF